ncbi:hypothetical protein IAQ61_002108 [Plenodomus lingam]|uniref:uncharacterized protein n=1 Tax=Leptosphaeria maculans TaxID=5022 RepID=UPI00331D29F9|nr:hypothetical protein IAQ61_002108 [Plenodomus lingam]
MSTPEHDSQEISQKKNPPTKIQGYPDYVTLSEVVDPHENANGPEPERTGRLHSQQETEKTDCSHRSNKDYRVAEALESKPRAMPQTAISIKNSKATAMETEASQTLIIVGGQDEPATDPEANQAISRSEPATTITPIYVPEVMARLWVKSLEPKKGNQIDERVIAIRHAAANEERFYLLEDLKWYTLHRVPQHRKDAWRKDTLKVAMTCEPVNFKVTDSENDEDSRNTAALYKGWTRFAVMAGHPNVDPLHHDEEAWKNSIYLSSYNRPIGEHAIRMHRERMKEVGDIHENGQEVGPIDAELEEDDNEANEGDEERKEEIEG